MPHANAERPDAISLNGLGNTLVTVIGGQAEEATVTLGSECSLGAMASVGFLHKLAIDRLESLEANAAALEVTKVTPLGNEFLAERCVCGMNQAQAQRSQSVCASFRGLLPMDTLEGPMPSSFNHVLIKQRDPFYLTATGA